MNVVLDDLRIWTERMAAVLDMYYGSRSAWWDLVESPLPGGFRLAVARGELGLDTLRQMLREFITRRALNDRLPVKVLTGPTMETGVHHLRSVRFTVN